MSLRVQDFGYGGGVQGSRMGRSLGVDPSTPTGSRSSSLRKNGDDQVSTSEFSPGLLDLHSFDTELLSEVSSLLHFLMKIFSLFLPLKCTRQYDRG